WMAFESADVLARGVEDRLRGVAERRGAEVVGQAGGVDCVRIAAEVAGQFAAHLSDLEGVGEPRPHEIVRARGHHLGLRAEAAQTGGMEDAGTVALEGRATWILRRFAHPPLFVPWRIDRHGPRPHRGARVSVEGHYHPPEMSSSASDSSDFPLGSKTRESNQPSGRCGRFGLVVRPREPSAAAPGEGASWSSSDSSPASSSREATMASW